MPSLLYLSSPSPPCTTGTAATGKQAPRKQLRASAASQASAALLPLLAHDGERSARQRFLAVYRYVVCRSAAVIEVDDRKHYGETRFRAMGYIGLPLYVMVFTLRDNAVRLISLRKANSREVKRYAQT